MIFNENTETFYTLFDYLKNKYNFKTKYITIDFSVAEYYGFKKVFKDIIIIPCFFHFCQNIVRHLPELKNKNNTIKNYAKDSFTNLKLLCFIEKEKVKNFYEEILYKFRSKFPKFFKYFEKYYFKKKSFNELCWNYNGPKNSDINKDIFFYTNNICESFNKSINSKYIGKCKTLQHFKKAIIDLIDIYNVKKCYQEKKLRTSRALAYFVSRNDVINLINIKDLEKIKQTYKEYLKKNKIPFENTNYESDSEDNYNKKIDSDYDTESDNYEEDEDIDNIDIQNDYNDNDDDDNNNPDDNEDSDGNKNDNKINKKNNKHNNHKNKNKNYNRETKNDKNNENNYIANSNSNSTDKNDGIKCFLNKNINIKNNNDKNIIMKDKSNYYIDYFKKDLSFHKYGLDLDNSNKKDLNFSYAKQKNIICLLPINNINYNEKYFDFNNNEKCESLLILNNKLNKLSLEENYYTDYINTILALRKRKIENFLFKKRNILYFSDK